ncbi:hypothetical protein ACWDV4_06690 [Micromonospora sp. NPDC003197]
MSHRDDPDDAEVASSETVRPADPPVEDPPEAGPVDASDAENDDRYLPL